MPGSRFTDSSPIPAPMVLPVKNAAGHIIPGGEHSLVEFALLPIFIGTELSDLSLMLKSAWVQHFSDGQILFKANDPAIHFHAVLDGHVELFVEKGGHRSVLEVAQRPTIIGEGALYGEGGHRETARIVGHTRLLIVPAAEFLDVLNGRFDLTLRMLAVMSTRMRGLLQQISALKIKSTAQRLAGFLLGIADTQNDIITARFPYDKRLAAEVLGMSPESLSRALVRLAPLGIQSHSDNVVIIHDLGALRAFCGEDGLA